MTVIYGLCAAILFVAALVVLRRVRSGPSMLDRMVALDLLTSVILGSVCVLIAYTRRTDLLPVLVVMAIVGFIGATTVSRFVAEENRVDTKGLSKEQVRRLLQGQRHD